MSGTLPGIDTYRGVHHVGCARYGSGARRVSSYGIQPTGGGCVERTVTTSDGVRLAVRDYGSDRADAPTVVLLHGLLLSQDSWDPQVRQLRRQWGSRIRIITYDHRGHGRSIGAPMPTYEIDQLAADLAEVLVALHIKGPLTLAGHSMGGMTALAYFGRPASKRPVEPQGLVLVGTAAGNIAERGISRLLATPATGALFELVHRMPQRATDKAVQKLVRPLGSALADTPARAPRPPRSRPPPFAQLR